METSLFIHSFVSELVTEQIKNELAAAERKLETQLKQVPLTEDSFELAVKRRLAISAYESLYDPQKITNEFQRRTNSYLSKLGDDVFRGIRTPTPQYLTSPALTTSRPHLYQLEGKIRSNVAALECHRDVALKNLETECTQRVLNRLNEASQEYHNKFISSQPSEH